MSLIACTDPCVYQIDGYCSLSRAASPGDGRSGCVNFVARSEYKSNFTLQDGGHGLPDVGHPDQVQPLRGGQLPLDPGGDHALGEA